MQFFVESRSPDYGPSMESMTEDEEDTRPDVHAFIEMPAEEWQPISVNRAPAETVVFVDGTHRVDARFWTNYEGFSRMGLCASFAAGYATCNGSATIGEVKVSRVAMGPAELQSIDCGGGIIYPRLTVEDPRSNVLQSKLHEQREALEIEIAQNAPLCDLLVIDGRLKAREDILNAIGYIKTHQTQYLEPEQAAVVGQLKPGQRTPFFLIQGGWIRYSWYVRLPGEPGYSWAGIARCEASPYLELDQVRELADRSAATLPRFASQSYKDPRAPQNLYPVGGLERDLRRRLGDPMLLLRALQRASHASSAVGSGNQAVV